MSPAPQFVIEPGCPECQSSALTLAYSLQSSDPASGGTVRLGSVTPVVYLGCDECSATVQIWPLQDFLDMLQRGMAP